MAFPRFLPTFYHWRPNDSLFDPIFLREAYPIIYETKRNKVSKAKLAKSSFSGFQNGSITFIAKLGKIADHLMSR